VFGAPPLGYWGGVAETWTPTLHLHEVAGRCRLSLAGITYGNGRTLQEAADDLVLRLLNIALCMRSSGFGFGSELRAMDREVLDFIWQVGERSARGEDVRELIF
jgi:hypothetical protein